MHIKWWRFEIVYDILSYKRMKYIILCLKPTWTLNRVYEISYCNILDFIFPMFKFCFLSFPCWLEKFIFLLISTRDCTGKARKFLQFSKLLEESIQFLYVNILLKRSHLFEFLWNQTMIKPKQASQIEEFLINKHYNSYLHFCIYSTRTEANKPNTMFFEF